MSTERAPEPTMEEILASIRRIISEDEANARQQPAEQVARPSAADSVEVDEGADTQIIETITRELSGAAPPSGGGEDDILDLTELGAVAEAAPEAPISAEPNEPAMVVQETLVETTILRAPDFAAAFPPAAPGAPEEPAPSSARAEEPETAEAPVQEHRAQQPDAEFTATPAEMPGEEPPRIEEPVAASAPPEEEPAPQPEPPQTPMSDFKQESDDATSALERAIAALKAGDLSAFAREAESDFVAKPSEPAPEAFMPPTSEPEPASFAAGEEQRPEAQATGESEPEAESPKPWDQPSFARESETTPWSAEPPPWRKESPEPAPRSNGSSGHGQHAFEGGAVPKSLEESVKEMLRPMLRQWLDENMTRVLTAALREELKETDLRRRD